MLLQMAKIVSSFKFNWNFSIAGILLLRFFLNFQIAYTFDNRMAERKTKTTLHKHTRDSKSVSSMM